MSDERAPRKMMIADPMRSHRSSAPAIPTFPALGRATVLVAILSLLLLFLLAPLAHPVWSAPARPDDSPELPAKDEWHLLYLGGKPAGFLHVRAASSGDGGWVVTQRQKMIVQRDAAVSTIEVTVTTREDKDGKLLSFDVEQQLSGQRLWTHGDLTPEGIRIKDRVADGPERSSTAPPAPDVVAPHRLDALLAAALREPGDQHEAVVFLPELRRSSQQTSRAVAREPLERPGGKTPGGTTPEGKAQALLRIETRLDALPGVVSTTWVDEHGDLVKSSLPLLGLTVETYRSSAAEVLAQSFATPPEVFLSLAVPVSRAVPETARKATYRLRWKDAAAGKEAEELLKGLPGLGVEAQAEQGVWTLRIGERVAPEKLLRPLKPPAEAPGAGRPNLYVECEDPAIVEVARRETEGIDGAWAAACRLEAWVHDAVKVKDLKTVFATASEVLKTRSGDCTEHAVLLAALLRAAGIPSRVVVGLVHHKKAFYGHMWTEAYVGAWAPLDATRARGGVGPDHIPLGASTLESSDLAELFLRFLTLAGKVEIEVVDAS